MQEFISSQWAYKWRRFSCKGLNCLPFTSLSNYFKTDFFLIFLNDIPPARSALSQNRLLRWSEINNFFVSSIMHFIYLFILANKPCLLWEEDHQRYSIIYGKMDNRVPLTCYLSSSKTNTELKVQELKTDQLCDWGFGNQFLWSSIQRKQPSKNVVTNYSSYQCPSYCIHELFPW